MLHPRAPPTLLLGSKEAGKAELEKRKGNHPGPLCKGTSQGTQAP